MNRSALLDVSNLVVSFDTSHRTIRAVDGVSLTVHEGEALAIVGESGSGKSVTSLAIMGLLAPAARVDRGNIKFRGTDLLGLAPGQRRKLRGTEMAMIYQDSMAALNPSLTVGRQIGEVIRHHEGLGRRAAVVRASELLELVGFADPRQRLDDYPHQLSGGQRQRVLIAMSLSCSPSLLIADEPTTALDVTIQAQVIDLVKRLREEFGMAIVWVTHDMGVVADLVDTVAVMYAGRLVERGPVKSVFARPAHPYTVGLLRSLPRLDGPRERLVPIPGGLPSIAESATHCAFASRCDWSRERCHADVPKLEPVTVEHESACFRSSDVSPTEPDLEPSESAGGAR